MAIVKANYLRRGPTTVAAAKRAARYYLTRSGEDRDLRQWYAQDGQAVADEDVQQAIAAHAATYAYTYRVVLSTKAHDLGLDGYRQALADQFDRYFLIEHRNTAHPHAHVLGFRHTRARKGELTTLRERVVGLEQAAERNQTRTHTLEHGPAGSHHARQQDRDLELGG